MLPVLRGAMPFRLSKELGISPRRYFSSRSRFALDEFVWSGITRCSFSLLLRSSHFPCRHGFVRSLQRSPATRFPAHLANPAIHVQPSSSQTDLNSTWLGQSSLPAY